MNRAKEWEFREVKYSDLKDGRIVEFREECQFLIINGLLYPVGNIPLGGVSELENKDFKNIVCICESTTGEAIIVNKRFGER